MTVSREEIARRLDAIAPAVEALARHQEQCDMDGVMVKVSRQAVDEVVNAVNQLAIDISSALRAAAELDHRTSGERWRHKKRGTTYAVIGRGKLQSSDPTGLGDNQPMVVYRSEADGSIWVRPADEFEDGRFERLSASYLPDHQSAASHSQEVPLAVRLRDEAGPPLPQMVAQRRAQLASQAGSEASSVTCPNCKDTKRSLYFSEQSWSNEERECHVCRPAPEQAAQGDVAETAAKRGGTV